MATTYLILNGCFVVVIIGLLWLCRTLVVSKATIITLIVLFFTTLIFDAIIIAMHIVDYDPALILNFRPFGVPVEDLFYSLLAAIAIPSIWHATGRKRDAH